MPEVVAVVGSRSNISEDLVRAYVRSLPKGTILVSGGAPGVDIWAEDEARKCGLPCEIYHAKWRAGGMYNPRAGHERNTIVVQRAERLAIFWDGSSPGTGNTIDQTLAAGKPFILNPRGPLGAASSPGPAPHTSDTQTRPSRPHPH